MNYQSQILPLDRKGNILLAVNFARHKVGGERLNETDHAYFAYGNIDSLNDLTDITELCCSYLTNRKITPNHLSRVQKFNRSIMKRLSRIIGTEYVGRIEKLLTKRVPRSVIATRNGVLLLGLESTYSEVKTGLGSNTLRVIDVFNKKIKQEFRANDILSGYLVIHPVGVTDDGKAMIGLDAASVRNPILAELDTSNLECQNRFKNINATAHIVQLGSHWIAVEEDRLYKYPLGGSDAIAEFKKPKNVFDWSAATALDSNLIAFSGDKGLILSINCDTGKLVRYYPHRGCKRDDLAQVKLSDDGRWMASKIFNQTELVVTHIEKGESWKVADIKDEIVVEREEGPRSESNIPAGFNLIGNRLLVLDVNGVREVSIVRPTDESLIVISQQGKEGARVPLKFGPDKSPASLIKQAKLELQSDRVTDLFYPGCYIKSKVAKKAGWRMPDEKNALPLGESRLGGWPDLPANEVWPTWRERPMGFLAQINLADVALVEPDVRLPKKGTLLFFVGCSEDIYEDDLFDQQMYGLELLLEFANDAKNVVRVIYADSSTVLNRTNYVGEVLPGLFAPCPVSIKKGAMPLPHELAAAYEPLPFDDEERENYNELLDYLTNDLYVNQLSGYPKMLQFTPLEWGVENQSKGIDQYHIPRDVKELAIMNEAATRWGLLFQFTSDCNADYIWGDGGHLYVYGDRHEMEMGNFDNCYMAFEN